LCGEHDAEESVNHAPFISRAAPFTGVALRHFRRTTTEKYLLHFKGEVTPAVIEAENLEDAKAKAKRWISIAMPPRHNISFILEKA